MTLTLTDSSKRVTKVFGCNAEIIEHLLSRIELKNYTVLLEVGI